MVLKVFSCLFFFLVAANGNEVGHHHHRNHYHHHATSDRSLGSLPNVFLIGSQKSGTTSLWELLQRLPGICNSTKKETHFFDRYESFRRGKDAYFEMLMVQNCTAVEIVLDATPDYIKQRSTLDHMMKSYSLEDWSKKKFIVVLRDPVEREFSLYTHCLRDCGSTMMGSNDSATACISKRRTFVTSCCTKLGCPQLPLELRNSSEARMYLRTFAEYFHNKSMRVESSNYLHQLQEWTRFIPQSSIFIINMQTFLRNTSDVMSRLQLFLGLDSSLPINSTLPHDNESHVSAKLDCATHDLLLAYYNKTNEGLESFINSKKNRCKFQPYFPPFDATLKCTP